MYFPGADDVVVLPPKRLDPAADGRSGVCSCGKTFKISRRGFASRKWSEHEHNPVWDGSNIYFINRPL